MLFDWWAFTRSFWVQPVKTSATAVPVTSSFLMVAELGSRAGRHPSARRVSARLDPIARRRKLLLAWHDDGPVRRLRDPQRVPEGITKAAIGAVEALDWLLRELDTGRLELFIGCAAVVGLEDHTRAGTLRNQLAQLRHCRLVMDRRRWDHQDELEFSVTREDECEPAHVT